MLRRVLLLIGWTFVPALELRASIPIGIVTYSMSAPLVFAVCIVANIVLGIVFYLFLGRLVKFLRRIMWFDRLYRRVLERSQRKIERFVNKYGEIGVAIFIGIPLPGSGVYTGALGSYAIGLSFRKFLVANIVGVLIAGVIVTLVTVTGSSLFRFFIRPPSPEATTLLVRALFRLG